MEVYTLKPPEKSYYHVHKVTEQDIYRYFGKLEVVLIHVGFVVVLELLTLV